MEAKAMFMLKLATPEHRQTAILTKSGDIRTGVILESQKKFKKRDKAKQPKQVEQKKLSRREIKQLGLYAIPHDTIKYADALLLHKMWREYMGRICKDNQTYNVESMQYNNIVARILKADFHGAKIGITRSKQSSVVGMKGIVILDTKGTFKIVSKDNKIRTIPKDDSLFEVYVGEQVISIFGKYLNARPAERSSRKMKVFPIPDL